MDMNHFTKSDAYKELVAITVRPFVLEFQYDFHNAIAAHDAAAKLLSDFTTKHKKSLERFHRKIFERQSEVHSERQKYLESFRGNFKDVVIPPTIRSADAELVPDYRGMRPLSLDNKELTQYLKSNGKGAPYTANAPPSIRHLLGPQVPFFTPTLDPSLPPVAYRIIHSSELIWLGQRAHWLYVKDETATHTLWAMHCLWRDNAPIIHAVLRRPGEFLPGAGAILTHITRQRGGACELRMETTEDITVVETPDRANISKDWAPRRFTYGGRKFVWKTAESGGTFKMPGWEWETLYEYSRAWPREGSKTGMMDDEVVGDRLCWGAKGGAKGVEGTLFFKGGLDQKFREHCLASQLARFLRMRYPANRNEEKVGAGAVVDLADRFMGLISS